MVSRDGIRVSIVKGTPTKHSSQVYEPRTTGESSESGAAPDIKNTTCRIFPEAGQHFFVHVDIQLTAELHGSEAPDVLVEASIDGGCFMARMAMSRRCLVEEGEVFLDLFRDPRGVDYGNPKSRTKSRNTYHNVKFIDKISAGQSAEGEIRVFVLEGIKSENSDSRRFGPWYGSHSSSDEGENTFVEQYGQGRHTDDPDMPMRWKSFEHQKGLEFVFKYEIAGKYVDAGSGFGRRRETFLPNDTANNHKATRLAVQAQRQSLKRPRSPPVMTESHILEMFDDDDGEDDPQPPRRRATANLSHRFLGSGGATREVAHNGQGGFQRKKAMFRKGLPQPPIDRDSSPESTATCTELQSMTNEQLDMEEQRLKLEKRQLDIEMRKLELEARLLKLSEEKMRRGILE